MKGYATYPAIKIVCMALLCRLYQLGPQRLDVTVSRGKAHISRTCCIYSNRHTGKMSACYCFRPQAAYVAVGDGNEEHRAAGVMGWGFVRVALGAGAAAGGAGAGAEKGAGEQARSPLAGGAGSVGRRVADIAAAEVLGAALRQG